MKLAESKLRSLIKEEIKKLNEINLDYGVSDYEQKIIDDVYPRVWDELANFADDQNIDQADLVGNEVRVYYYDGHYDVAMTLDNPEDRDEALSAIEDWNNSPV